MMLEKLFAVYLGGYAPRCNTELHDVVFAIGCSIEETYPQLIEKWFGDVKRLHIDSWVELTVVDGHRVTLSREKSDSSKKLYFINLGAYVPEKFMEFHENVFFVGENAEGVKKRARESLCKGMIKIHKDDLYDVDDCIQVEIGDGLHVQLEPTSQNLPLTPSSAYHPLPKKMIEVATKKF